jgi:hypothetical protein
MGFNLGVRPSRTFVGIVLCMVGLPLWIRVFTDITNVPIWLAFVGALIFGVGVGMLLRQWYETRTLRREARAWADEHAEEIAERTWLSPEDDPNWVAWSRQQVDNPEKPTDEFDEGAQ